MDIHEDTLTQPHTADDAANTGGKCHQTWYQQAYEWRVYPDHFSSLKTTIMNLLYKTQEHFLNGNDQYSGLWRKSTQDRLNLLYQGKAHLRYRN
jgi:hypothetical protein